MAKNNRGVVTEEQTTVLVSQIGDPAKLSFLDSLKEEGEYSIILVDLSTSVGIRTYETLKNSPDKFAVVLEDDHSGRHSVYVVMRYVRKTECRLEDLIPELKFLLGSGSPKSSKKSPAKKKAGKKKAGKKKATRKKVGFHAH